MRKNLLMLPVAAAAMFATAAVAQPVHSRPGAPAAGVAAGVAAGTIVGYGVADGWFGTTAAAVGTAGAAAIGGAAGIGTVALLHAATTPCQGFHALFGGFLTSSAGCQNGQWVGYAPPRVVRR